MDQLPHLLRLLDDETPAVRRAIQKEFAAFGTGLDEALARLPAPPDEAQRRRLREIIEDYQRDWLRENWPTWFDAPGRHARLEKAFGLLASFQGGFGRSVDLRKLLDGLAEECREAYPMITVGALAEFLFKKKGLRGAPPETYYDPRNSDLVSVVERKRGLPITLTAVYMLVGGRLGLEIGGCNFPGHFLAVVDANRGRYFVDCFNGGRFHTGEEIIAMTRAPGAALKRLLAVPADPETIMARVLRNLDAAYEKARQPENSRLVGELFAAMAR